MPSLTDTAIRPRIDQLDHCNRSRRAVEVNVDQCIELVRATSGLQQAIHRAFARREIL
ncbi:hypothetical protein ABIB83_008754 [Bradyrhizobium sp. I1.8.5]